MSGIFGSSEGKKGQKKLAQDTQMYIGQGLAQLNPAAATADIKSAMKKLGKGLTPASYSGPGYGITVSPTGNIGMTRTAENQAFMDKLGLGLNTDETAYNDLLSQITPGFGRLSNSIRDRWNADASKAVGNLRDQLARRRVAGASFANDQIGSMQAEYDMRKDAALSEALIQELKMTQDVIGARTNARNATIAQAFDQIQFEGNLGGQLMQSVMANQNNLQMAMADLAKTSATIKAGLQQTGANLVAQLGSTATGQAAQFADIRAREAAGPGMLLGSIVGTGLGGWASGGFKT